MQILVTNDDGYSAAGIDAVVQYLTSLPDVEVTVVAPLENQSGSGDSTSPGELRTRNVQTVGGYPAVAVRGFPADSVNWALDGGVEQHPDLVVSGSNEGQNYAAMIIPISGTIGAAATAARAGIPAIAISQGIPHAGQEADYEASVDALDKYLDTTLDEYRSGDAANVLVSLNVPTCPEGARLYGIRITQPATDWGDRPPLAAAPCDGPLRGKPVDDVDAFNHGYPSLTALDPDTLAGVPYRGDRPSTN